MFAKLEKTAQSKLFLVIRFVLSIDMLFTYYGHYAPKIKNCPQAGAYAEENINSLSSVFHSTNSY